MSYWNRQLVCDSNCQPVACWEVAAGWHGLFIIVGMFHQFGSRCKDLGGFNCRGDTRCSSNGYYELRWLRDKRQVGFTPPSTTSAVCFYLLGRCVIGFIAPLWCVFYECTMSYLTSAGKCWSVCDDGMSYLLGISVANCLTDYWSIGPLSPFIDLQLQTAIRVERLFLRCWAQYWPDVCSVLHSLSSYILVWECHLLSASIWQCSHTCDSISRVLEVSMSPFIKFYAFVYCSYLLWKDC